MMVVRPIRTDDWASLRALASKTGPGFTSLQDDDGQVQAKLDAGVAAFEPERAAELANYLFALEDSETGEVVGCCGIDAAVGLDNPWYNYRVGTIVQASKELDVYSKTQILTLSNDYTGFSELCSLFLDPDYRHNKNGSLLSKARFMFMAQFADRFYHTILAEMRGYSDEDGVSPFWEGLGRHFFTIDFDQADQLTMHSKVFIAELMPKYPIYTNLLPPDAVEAIAKTHKNTTPARRLLENEGFRYTGHVDIFDAGPALEAPLQDIRAVRESRLVTVVVSDEETHGQPYLVSNTHFANFRCGLSALNRVGPDRVQITHAKAKTLNVKTGDTLRVVALSAERSF